MSLRVLEWYLTVINCPFSSRAESTVEYIFSGEPRDVLDHMDSFQFQALPTPPGNFQLSEGCQKSHSLLEFEDLTDAD